MIRALDSRLRGRGFDSRSFHFQVSMLKHSAYSQQYFKCAKFQRSVCPQTRFRHSHPTSFSVCSNSRPLCIGQPYCRLGSDCAHTERQPSVRKLHVHSGSPCAAGIAL